MPDMIGELPTVASPAERALGPRPEGSLRPDAIDRAIASVDWPVAAAVASLDTATSTKASNNSHLMRNALALVTAAAEIAVACSPGVAPTAAPTGTPEITSMPSPIVTESPLPPTMVPTDTPIVIETPTATPEPTKTPEAVTAPQIDGLKLAVVDGKQTYTALKDNPYGLKEGDYAGEFVPNVQTEASDNQMEQTGGLVMESSVVKKILNDQLAQIQKPADKWLVPLPVDIRTATSQVSVSFNSNSSDQGTIFQGEQYAFVNWGQESLRVIDLFSDESVQIWANDTGLNYITSNMALNDKISPDAPMEFIYTFGKYGLSAGGVAGEFGEAIAEAKGSTYLGLSAQKEWLDVAYNKILTVDNTPVFMAANNS